MECKKIAVAVSRQAMEDTSIDLPKYLDAVYEAILRNYQLFGAEEKYDIYPEEVSLSHVVIYNYKTRSFTRASISTDESGNVSFSSVEKVKRQWVPVEDVVQRSTNKNESPDEFYPVEMVQRGTFWSSFIHM